MPWYENLGDLKYFGFWGASDMRSDLRITQFQSFHANLLFPSPNADVRLKLDNIGAGYTGRGAVSPHDWYDNVDQPKSEWVFNPQKGRDTLDAAAQAGELPQNILAYYGAHEAQEYIIADEADEMADIIRDYYPDVPIAWYYGGQGIEVIHQRLGKKHRRGCLWDDMLPRASFCDIFVMGLGPNMKEGRLDYESLVGRAAARVPLVPNESKLWINGTLLGAEPIVNGRPTGFPRPKDLSLWAKMVVGLASPEALLMRGLGRLEYDIAYGLPTSETSKAEEFGLIEERAVMQEFGALRALYHKWGEDPSCNAA